MNDFQDPLQLAVTALSETGLSSKVDLQMDFEGGSHLTWLCHELAARSGWWKEYDAMPEQYRKHFIGAKMALVHSEVSETVEGQRKGLMDSHLPHRSAEEVEMADTIIRLLDIAGKRKLDVFGAIIEKLAYNQQRADHKPENRAAEGGKGF